MKLARIAFCLLFVFAAVSCSTSTPQPTVQPPTLTLTPSLPATEAPPAATATPTGPLGSISGKILPVPPEVPLGALRVYAQEVDSGQSTFVEIPDGQTTYTISGLPVGKYYAVGQYYPKGVVGAYTSAKIPSAVDSIDQLKCNTAILTIILKPNSMDFQGADIGCWGGDFYSILNLTK